ncbi:MAG: dockerin type I repeat-containing protein [Candidatus Zixiibacteriota bacterium]
MSFNFEPRRIFRISAIFIVLTIFASLGTMAAPFEITIGSALDIPMGGTISVPVTKTGGSENLGGFDFKILFEADAISLNGVTSGEVFDIPGDYEWEYFTFRVDSSDVQFPDFGNLRIVGMANINNGPHVPIDLNISDGTVLFRLDFTATTDLAYANEFTPIKFRWNDCGDNAIVYGDSLLLGLSNNVYDFDGFVITDTQADFPTYGGAPNFCFDGYGDNPPLKFVDFYNGGIAFGDGPAGCQLEVFINDTTGYSGGTGVFSIYMNNFADTVVGFDLLLLLGNSEVAEFMVDDVTGNAIFDTTGTLCSGWEYIQARTMSSSGYAIRIVGLADILNGPFVNPGISPQSNGVPLIKIPVAILNPMFQTGVEIFIQSDMLSDFTFVDPSGANIGLIEITTPDTSWFNCQSWNGDECLLWEEVSSAPADSFYVEYSTTPLLDTEYVCISNGSLTLLDGILCGDANGDRIVNILDITRTIGCIYFPIDPPCDLSMMDVDGNGTINILDLVYIIKYLYKGGPAPICNNITN